MLVQARGYDGYEWWSAVDEEGRDVFAYALMGMGEWHRAWSKGTSMSN